MRNIVLQSIFWHICMASGHFLVHTRMPIPLPPSNESVSIVFLPEQDAEVMSRGFMQIPEKRLRPLRSGSTSSTTMVDLASIHQLISSSGQCLNFLHIPKNAGTSMENYKVSGKFGGWGMNDKSLQCSRKGDCGKVPWPCINGCQISEEGMDGICSIWHVPPSTDPKLAESYNHCDTFCLVRDPLKKVISQHMFEGGQCNLADFEKKARQRFNVDLKSNKFAYDCHYVKQVDYVFGHGRGRSKPFCQHVLHLENLKSGFAELMAKFHLPLEVVPHDNSRHCDLKPADIASDVLHLIDTYYADDYKTFGYHDNGKSFLDVEGIGWKDGFLSK